MYHMVKTVIEMIVILLEIMIIENKELLIWVRIHLHLLN